MNCVVEDTSFKMLVMLLSIIPILHVIEKFYNIIIYMIKFSGTESITLWIFQLVILRNLFTNFVAGYFKIYLNF